MDVVVVVSSESSANGVIITMTHEAGYSRLKAWPGCCTGSFRVRLDGSRMCECGSTEISSKFWECWFYLTPTTEPVLRDWLETWTGLKEVEVSIKWD